MYYSERPLRYRLLDRLRRLSWYERIKSGPSPEDGAILQITRELAVQLESRFWYRHIFWGRFDRGGVGWLISKPVISRELWLGSIGVPEADLMLPEYLKGRLSLDEWRLIIAMHMARMKAYNSGRMSKLLGLMCLAVLAAFVPILLLLPEVIGRAWGSVLTLPAWTPTILLSFLWLRRYIRGWEFELDAQVAAKFGTEKVLQVLQRMQTLDPRAGLTSRLARFVAFWNPSIAQRTNELRNPAAVHLPRPSRTPKLGLRGRAIIVLVGFGIFWGSGIIAGNLYARDQITVACVTNGCAALVVISAVGYWTAILGGISIVLWAARRFGQARRKRKFQV